VPCWIDVESSDPQQASEFYGELFGWTFQNAMPDDAASKYLIASLDGQDVAAIGVGDDCWNTYIAVDDADAMARAVESNGGAAIATPQDAEPGGRLAICADPAGAEFRLWQGRRRPGAQVVNVPGSWNFSNLRSANPQKSMSFYSRVFGWTSIGENPALGIMAAQPGYGEHLASTVDPDIYERQSEAPEGFADIVAGIEPAATNEGDRWLVKISVANRDDAVEMVEKLGGSMLSESENPWTKEAVVNDPFGAQFAVSQFLG
jgi:predicted enzyme related to lactoylglutathione lyase